MSKNKNENLQNLLIGVLAVARAVSDLLHDGFQAKDIADLILKYHDQESDFGDILDKAIASAPKIGDDLKDFEFNQLLGLVMGIYPEVEQLIGSLQKINLKGKSSEDKAHLIAETVTTTRVSSPGAVGSLEEPKPC